jgi:tetratricopeptide (TPR) repeat protein
MKPSVKRFATVLLFLSFFAGFPLSAEESPENQLRQDVSDAFQGNDYKRVIRLYRQFVASKPDRDIPAGVKILYSQALADTGDLDGAIDAMKNVLADVRPESDPIQLQYDLANLLFLQKRFDEARTAYQKLLLQTGRNAELLSKAKERLALMKDGDANAKRKDIESLQMIDLETTLDAGEVPDGAEQALARIIRRDPKSQQAAEAKSLQERIRGLRSQKAKALLDEARRLFDEEKKYVEVRDILDQIQSSYADVCETASVEALRKAVDSKAGKTAR